jgi:hypothetical protein
MAPQPTLVEETEYDLMITQLRHHDLRPTSCPPRQECPWDNACARLMGKSLRGKEKMESPDVALALTFGDRHAISGQLTLSAAQVLKAGPANRRPGRAVDCRLISCRLVRVEGRRCTICQFGPCGQSRLPFGSVRGSRSSPLARSPGYSVAHCGRARKERFSPDVSRDARNWPALQLHEGDEANRSCCRPQRRQIAAVSV